MSTHEQGLLSTVANIAGLLSRLGPITTDIRIDFPVFVVEDTKWCTTLVADAARELHALAVEARATSGKRRPGLVVVLCARATCVELARQLKLRTSHAAVKAIDLNAKRRGPFRDPATDSRATVYDFAWRLRRMGGGGNVRVDLPLSDVDDLPVVAGLMDQASRDLLKLYKSRKLTPFEHVLDTRAIVSRIGAALRMRRENVEMKEAKRA